MSANLLIAHLDSFTIRAIEVVLRDEHHTFSEARDGFDVIDRALDNMPDGILLGLKLPGLDGLDVARALRALEPTRHIPILFLAAGPEEAAEVERAGISHSDWAVAPLDLAKLRTHLNRMLRPPRVTQPSPESAALNLLATIRDPLTGFFERPYILHRLAYEGTRAARYHTPLACIMVRIEGWDHLIEKHGRVAADRLLAEVADTLRHSARGADILGRSGPRDLLIVAPHTEETGAHLFAERLRNRACTQAANAAGEPVEVQVGVAWARGDDLSENLALLGQAEAALSNAQES